MNYALKETISRYSVILEKSLSHTHCRGLHSLVFRDKPNMLRLYFADSDHELWRNELFWSEANGERKFVYNMSIALHSHKQDIRLFPIFGKVYNTLFVRYGPCISFNAYRYTSPILNTKPGFQHVGLERLGYANTLRLFSETFMRAEELHTIYVPRGQKAAWLIEEGKEDLNYDNTCFSNHDLTKYSFEGLYQPMTGDKAHIILDECLK